MGRDVVAASRSVGVAMARRVGGLALALVAPAIGLGIHRLPGPDLGPPYLLFCPPILVAAMVSGPWAGILSTALASTLAAQWVLAGRGAAPVSAQSAVSLAAFVLSGLLVSLLAHLHRKARDRVAAVDRATALQETSARLAESEDRLRRTRRDAKITAAQLAAVIEAVQDGISLADRSGRFVLVNRALVRLHGFTSGDDAWADVSSAFADLELSELGGGVVPREGWPTARVLGGESFVDWELRARRRAAEREAILSYSGAPIRGEDGAVEAAVVVTRDITEPKQAALRLDAERQRLAVTLQSIGDAVIATDVTTRITAFNDVAQQLTGWSAAEALGRPLAEVFRIESEDDGAPMEDPTVRVLRDGIVVGLANHAALVARDGGRRPIADSAAPIRAAGGEIIGVVLVFRDQSAERQAEQLRARDVSERLALEQQLGRAQKLESVGRLAGGVAHDFNNLLTVILAGVAELRRARGDGAAVQEIVEEIGAAGGRARELTQQLLAFARKQVLAPVDLDLSAVVRETERLLRRLLGEDVLLTTGLALDLWPVRCDRAQVEQIIVNLAVNARDAMPQGGQLRLETANVELPWVDAAAAREGLRPGRWVRLTVTDDGEGMTPEVRERIFEPFFSTKETGKGTGLGLSTVYGIVTQSDGFVRVSSEPGRGTVFEVYLPEAEPSAQPAAAPEEAPSAGDEQSGGSETILLVEDDAQVRTVTVRTLRSAGYEVLVASGGEEALELSAHEPGRIHLLLTDVVMPGMGGRAVAERLIARRPELRVLYVSGHARDVFDRGGVLEPGIAFLPKPFTPDALLARLRAVLDAPAVAPREGA